VLEAPPAAGNGARSRRRKTHRRRTSRRT
jgi:hypothetical protein